MLEIPRPGGGLQAIQRKTVSKQGMRLNAIRCLPCKGAGPVTSTSQASLQKKEGEPGAWGLGPGATGVPGNGGCTTITGLARMQTGACVGYP